MGMNAGVASSPGGLKPEPELPPKVSVVAMRKSEDAGARVAHRAAAVDLERDAAGGADHGHALAHGQGRVAGADRGRDEARGCGAVDTHHGEVEILAVQHTELARDDGAAREDVGHHHGLQAWAAGYVHMITLN